MKYQIYCTKCNSRLIRLSHILREEYGIKGELFILENERCVNPKPRFEFQCLNCGKRFSLDGGVVYMTNFHNERLMEYDPDGED